MPKHKKQPLGQSRDGTVIQTGLAGRSDDFDDYLEYDCESPEGLRDLIETIERIEQGTDEMFPLEEVVAELEMEDRVR